MTNTEIIVNLATIIAEQRLEISELKTEVAHLHHELIATMSEADTPQTEGYMTEEQAEDYRKMLDKAEHKVYGNTVDTPQAESYYKKEDVVRVVENVKRGYGLTKSAEDIVPEMQTDCGWK